MKTATFMKEWTIPENGAQQQLYRCSPPLGGHEYIVVSAIVAMFSGPETYIFGANETGKITDWSELKGSYRGGLDHDLALLEAGYTVVDESREEDIRDESERRARNVLLNN
jgi:hypothetical protein